MTKNLFINALSATLYIIAVASVMYYGPKWAGPTDSVVAPIAILSLFVLSAAVMGCLFFYRPIQLYYSLARIPARKRAGKPRGILRADNKVTGAAVIGADV